MNLLITGAWSDAKQHITTLEAMGHTITFMQWETEPIPCDYEWVEGVICNNLFATHSIDRFKNLRYIQLTSAGFDRVPMDVIATRRIAIHNARGVYSAPMAEFAVTAVLHFYKGVNTFVRNQQQHIWQKQRDIRELSGKTVAIVGCGNVGQACAKRFAAFDCDIIGVDINTTLRENFRHIYPVDALAKVLADADIVLITLPLTETTYHLINQTVIDGLPKGCVLVNIARGAIVDTDALLPRLQRGEISAALDVFEQEPLAADSPLWDLDNVLLTPHNSFVGDKSVDRLSQLILTSLQHKEQGC